MTERWVSMVVSGNKVIVVDAEMVDTGPLVLQADVTWTLQSDDRPAAYNVLRQQCADYLRENKIAKALVNESAASRRAVNVSHFHSAELRGVVQAAAASVCEVKTIAKGTLSRTYGDRKVDEYAKDEEFWDEHFDGGDLRVGSRTAAIMLLAERV